MTAFPADMEGSSHSLRFLEKLPDLMLLALHFNGEVVYIVVDSRFFQAGYHRISLLSVYRNKIVCCYFFFLSY